MRSHREGRALFKARIRLNIPGLRRFGTSDRLGAQPAGMFRLSTSSGPVELAAGVTPGPQPFGCVKLSSSSLRRHVMRRTLIATAALLASVIALDASAQQAYVMRKQVSADTARKLVDACLAYSKE